MTYNIIISYILLLIINNNDYILINCNKIKLL